MSIDGHSERRVRVPVFPPYGEVRHLLRVWQGRSRSEVTGLHATLATLRGTPQKPVNWTDPNEWIPDRLEGDDRGLAEAIWEESKFTVNPRYTYGHWLMSNTYELLADASGKLILTDRGQSFVTHEGGEVEAFIDDREGVLELLGLVVAKGPVAVSGLREEWAEYLSQHSNFSTGATRRDTLRRRLANLCRRDLLARRGNKYSPTDSGKRYYERLGRAEPSGGPSAQAVRELASKVRVSARNELRQLLLEMDPYKFEHLIKRLLEEMHYQDVKVTKESGDGGVDLVAEIEIGITSVKEVVQAKRHKKTIQRKVLDALRGSLHRFDAVRGTIVTTSKFTSGTQSAAFERGAAPITLVDGDKLIDLLIEHGIGARKEDVEIVRIDRAALDNIMRDDSDSIPAP